MSAIAAVVFDIGNVLIEWAPERWYDARIGPSRRRALFAQVDLEGMNARVDRGEDIGAAVEALARAHPGWAQEIRHWRDHWIEMASPEIPGSVALLAALRARGVPLYALSNFGAATFAIAQAHYPFLRGFRHAFVSAHLGLMKPEPEIYRHLEAETGFAPDALFFIDDRPENVAAAAARGWRTHLFTSPEGLAARLVAEGLLSESEAA